MRDVWKKLLVQGVVLACLVPTSSESENVLIRPKCKSNSNCEEVKSEDASDRNFFYNVSGSKARGQEQQVIVRYENDKKSFLLSCNSRVGDPELAVGDSALPTMPKPTIIKKLEFVGCLVPNISYYDAIKALNIVLSSGDSVLILSELPKEPRLEEYHLKGLPIKGLIITASTDNPPTRPKKDFLNGLPQLKILELENGMEPEEEARMLIPESLERLVLFNTRLLLPPVNATETQRDQSHWLYRLSSLKSLRLREISTKASKGWVVLPPLTHTAFPNLTDLSLIEISLAPMLNNVSWLKGSNLRSLVMNFCRLEEIPDNFFEDANITNIDFSNNTLGSLPEDVFAPLQSSLRVLDLSHNRLKGPELVRAVQSLTQLETLKVNNNPLESLCGSGQHYAYGRVESGLPLRSLRTLELRRTQATRICYDWIENDFLSVIDLDKNNINFLWGSDLRMRRKENKPVTLRVRNKKNNPVKIIIDKKDYDQCQQESVSESGGTRKRVQVKLKLNSFSCDCKAYWLREMLHNCSLLQSAKMNDVNCSTKYELEQSPLLSHNRDSLTCPYHGRCPAGCSCSKRLPDNATVVRCAGAVTQTQPWPPGLIALHVEPGVLSAVPDLKLVELHAPNNIITNIDKQNIPDTLRVLDVRNNSIKQITTAAAQALLDLSTEVDYKVWLAGNPLACACEDEAAISRLQRAKITDWNNTTCVDGRYVDKRKLCYDKMLPISLGVMGALLVLTLAALTLFCFRPRIRQFLFDRGMCLGYVLNVKDDVDDPMKTHDVFISYSHEDLEFAKELIERLEGRGHSTIEHNRDWDPGEKIQQQIVDSVMSARRTLLLLSENYVKSDWSKEEFHVAHAHAMERGSARVIVVLLCDLLSIRNLPDDLRLYLKTNTYLELKDSYFWDKMWRVMPQPRVAPPPAIALLQEKEFISSFKGQQVINVPALSRQSTEKDLTHSMLVLPVKQPKDGPLKSVGQNSSNTPRRKKHFLHLDYRSTLLESPAPMKCQLQEKTVVHHDVREKQIIADPALLLSRLSLDEYQPLVQVALVQQSQNGTDESLRQVSPVTPIVTEPPQFETDKSTLASNIQREPITSLMHESVSPSAC